MGGFELYLLFATSVALWACYEIMRPALHILRGNPEDVLVQNKTLAYLVMFCISWITAPFMVLCILNSELNSCVLSALVNRID